YSFARKYDNAIAQAQQSLALKPKDAVTLNWLEHAYRHKGMLKEAYATRLANTSSAEEVAAIEQAFRNGGYRAVLLLQAEAYKRRGAVGFAGRAFAAAGEKQAALDLLEECDRRHLTGLGALKVDPDFDSLHSEPRYIDLLKRLGYSQ